jgi:micrococcal nuclease
MFSVALVVMMVATSGCAAQSSSRGFSAGLVSPEPSTPAVNETPPPESAPPALSAAVVWNDAGSHIGENTSVGGPVVSTRYASDSKGAPTFLNVGLNYPDPGRLTVVIFGDSRGAFPNAPEEMYAGKTVIVDGVIELYKGTPEIIVDSPDDITVVD